MITIIYSFIAAETSFSSQQNCWWTSFNRVWISSWHCKTWHCHPITSPEHKVTYSADIHVSGRLCHQLTWHSCSNVRTLFPWVTTIHMHTNMLRSLGDSSAVTTPAFGVYMQQYPPLTKYTQYFSGCLVTGTLFSSPHTIAINQAPMPRFSWLPHSFWYI